MYVPSIFLSSDIVGVLSIKELIVALDGSIYFNELLKTVQGKQDYLEFVWAILLKVLWESARAYCSFK